MLTIIFNILILVGLFGLTIFIHEFGHFIAARKCGLIVDVFSVGFGPAILKKKINGVVWKIGCIPLGGYVSIPQLDPTGMQQIQGKNDDESDEFESDKQKPRELPDVEPWKKIVVAVAGAFFNVLLAMVFALIIALNPHAITGTGNTEIGYVDKDSQAYSQGIRSGDKIVSVNGEAIHTWYDYNMLCLIKSGESETVDLGIESKGKVQIHKLPLATTLSKRISVKGIEPSHICIIGAVVAGSPADKAGLKAKDIVEKINNINVVHLKQMQDLIASMPDKEVSITVKRNREILTLKVTPKFEPKIKRAVIGITLSVLRPPPWMAFKGFGNQIKNDSRQIVRLLRALVTPKESAPAAGALGGAPMILMTIWMSLVSYGMLSALAFIRFLNINLAILNLLPIPVLDGGHIMFAIWEIITGKKPHPKVVNALVNVFAVILIGLMLFLSGRDIFVQMPKIFSKNQDSEMRVKDTNGNAMPVGKENESEPSSQEAYQAN